MGALDDDAVHARITEVEALLDALDALEPAARELAIGAVRGIMALYGEGLARIVEWLEGAGAGARETARAALAEDEFVAHLLILHDLHPLDLATRVERALDGVRLQLRSQGGAVELIGIEDGVVHLRLSGSGNGRTSSSALLRGAVESAIRGAAPEIERIEVEGAVAGAVRRVAAPPVLVQLQGRRG